MTCEGVLFTPPVGCSRLPSAVNDLASIIFLKKKIMSSTRTTNATFDIDRKELVQVALLQILGGDGSLF